MSEEKALTPIDQRTVDFYGDNITAVLVDVDGEEQVFVPIRPICEFLGVAWQAQLRRIRRDPVLDDVATSVTVTVTEAGQRGEMVCLPLAIAALAEQQIEHERMIQTAVSRLDKAAAVVGELGKRVRVIEQRTAPGQPITEEQAAEISQQVKALAGLLTEQDSSKNHYQGIFNELYRRFGVTSYKNIPQGKYAAVLAFLEEWRGKVAE